MYSNSITLLISVGFLACGLADDSSGSNSNELSIGRRIKDGLTDVKNEFSYVVPLKSVYLNGENKKCSGTLLSARTVITSISCVNKENELSHVEVTLTSGVYYFWPRETFNVPSVCSQLDRKYLYLESTPSTTASPTCFDSGVVILRLGLKYGPMKGLSSIVFPKLPTTNMDYYEMEGIIAGWGNTKGDNEVSSSYGLYYYSPIHFIEYNSCEKSIDLPKDLKPQVYYNTTLCSYNMHATGLCAGDEGGALLVKDHGTMYIVGVHRNYFSSCTYEDVDLNINTLMLHYNLEPMAEYIQKIIRYRN